MELPRHSFRLLVLVAVASLASCIDGREEIWLAADGSGRADVCYSFPASAAKLQGGADGVERIVDGFLKNTPALASSSYEVTTDAERVKVRIRASFKSALDLRDVTAGDSAGKLPSSAGNLAGKVKLALQGMSMDFCRTISPGSALPGCSFMPASQFANRQLTYIIHLPEAATDSNATRIDDAGRTLIWEFPLAQAILSPVTTRFKVPIPIPSWLVATSAAAVLIIAFLGIQKLRRVTAR